MVSKEANVSKEEFGSLIAEYEGFRDMILDEMTKLREELENLREDLKDIKKLIDFDRERTDRKQRALL